jgi:hypothetical protein
MQKIFKHLTILVILLSSILNQSCTKNISKNINVELDRVTSKYVLRNSIRITDGPYILLEKDNVIEKIIVDGNVETNILDLDSRAIHFTPEKSVYQNVQKLAVFSDIHGQYDLAINILINNKIIDNNLNWNFGKGHLVILGDVFDRGGKVTEIFWFIYNLEKQAEKSGGKVHFLLGNHEFMILHNDLRYLHNKYELTSQLLDTTYDKLYGKQTLLGKWLRSKPTIIKINDILFVHGGISKEFIAQGFDLKITNQLLRESLDRDKAEMKSGSFYNKYYGRSGPLWYRGYFEDNLSDSEISQILNKLDVNHIIVGHTSQERIEKLYAGKIYAVDSSIKNGEYGEILLIDKGNFIRGTAENGRFKFD